MSTKMGRCLLLAYHFIEPENKAAKLEPNSDFAAFPYGKTCADTANEQEASQGSLPAKNQ